MYFRFVFSLTLSLPESCEDPLGNLEGESKRLSGPALWLSQYATLIVKRFHYTRRKIFALLVQNVLPMVIVLISLIIAYVLQSVPDLPKLELHPSLFFKTTRYNYMFVGGYETNRTSPYVDSLYQECGLGAHTLGSSVDPKSHCFAHPTDNYTCSHYPSHQYHCTCGHSCADQAPFPKQAAPCWNGTVTGTRLQDVTVPYNSSNVSVNHQALTTYLLRSKRSFIEQRYGGLSFGHAREEIDPSVDQVFARDVNSTLPFLATHSAAKVWYSLKGYHGMPAFLNTMNNALLKASLPEESQTQYGEQLLHTNTCTFRFPLELYM